MKRILSISTVALFVIASLASCKKDHTCTCVTTDDGTELSKVATTINAKKKDAESTCENGSSELGTLKTSCTLD